jgi:hypothetical protein
VLHEGVQLHEGTGIEQPLDALAGQQLSLFSLAIDCPGTARVPRLIS